MRFWSTDQLLPGATLLSALLLAACGTTSASTPGTTSPDAESGVEAGPGEGGLEAGVDAQLDGDGASDADSGPPPEGCVDIIVDGRIVDDPEQAKYPIQFPAHPFWRDDSGLHVGWIWADYTGSGIGPLSVMVSSFDPENGHVIGNRKFTVFGDSGPGNVAVAGVAAAPDGSQAVAYQYLSPGQTYWDQRVLLIPPGDAGSPTTWTPPFTTDQFEILHIAWDGEAFALHSFSVQGALDLNLVRLLPDGTVLQAPVIAARVSSVWPNYHDIQTDPSPSLPRWNGRNRGSA